MARPQAPGPDRVRVSLAFAPAWRLAQERPATDARNPHPAATGTTLAAPVRCRTPFPVSVILFPDFRPLSL